MMGPTTEAGAGSGHDHGACISGALAKAERLCRERGARLTPLRRAVLEQIWQSHEAVKAYDLIHRLSSADHTVKPPTVYRALEFLLDQGLIHRIESLNGFVGCTHPGLEHDVMLLICDACSKVMELTNGGAHRALCTEARRQGFQLNQPIVEGRGLCGQCRAQGHSDRLAATTSNSPW